MNPILDIDTLSYNELLRAEAKLNALLSAGVDNWEGWDFAMDIYRENLADLGLDDE